MENSKNIIERWNQTRERGKTPRRHRKLIWISAISAVCLIAIIFGLFLFTDVIIKPVESVGVVNNTGDWAMFGRDLAHAGAADSVAPSIQGNVKTVLTAGAAIHSSPVIAKGIIYFGSQDYKLYAVNQATGQKLWEFKTGSWVESSPVVVNDIVYFGSNDGNFYALNAQTGAKIWSFKGKYPIRSSAAVADGRIYVGSDDYAVYALDAATGEKVWEFKTGDIVVSSPAVVNGIVCVTSSDGYYYSVNASNGRQRLAFPASRALISSPALVGTTAYFCNSDGSLNAIDIKARNWFGESKLRTPWAVLALYGDLPPPPPLSGYLWSLDLRGSTISSPIIDGNSLYLGVGSMVNSINIDSQSLKWSYNAGDQVNYAFPLSDTTVGAVTQNGHFFVLNSSDGQKISDIVVGTGKITSLPLVSNGTVYITSEDGHLYAVN